MSSSLSREFIEAGRDSTPGSGFIVVRLYPSKSGPVPRVRLLPSVGRFLQHRRLSISIAHLARGFHQKSLKPPLLKPCVVQFPLFIRRVVGGHRRDVEGVPHRKRLCFFLGG